MSRNHRMTRTSITSTHSVRHSWPDIHVRQTRSHNIARKTSILWTATLDGRGFSSLGWRLSDLGCTAEWTAVEPGTALLHHRQLRLSDGRNRPVQSASLSALQLRRAINLTRTATVRHSWTLLGILHTKTDVYLQIYRKPSSAIFQLNLRCQFPLIFLLHCSITETVGISK